MGLEALYPKELHRNLMLIYNYIDLEGGGGYYFVFPASEIIPFVKARSSFTGMFSFSYVSGLGSV